MYEERLKGGFAEHRHDGYEYWHPVFRVHNLVIWEELKELKNKKEENKNMIKLDFEKIPTKNGRKLKLLKIKMISREDLPRKYLESDFYTWGYPPKQFFIYTKDTGKQTITVGEYFTEVQVKTILAKLVVCGKNLTKINAEIAKENEGWTGTITYEI